MNTGSNFHETDRPTRESAVMRKLWRSVRDLTQPSNKRFESFTTRLVASFRSGIPVPHPNEGEWFAILEIIEPEDHQVAALVRVSPRRPAGSHDPKRGIVDAEERGRELFAEPPARRESVCDDLLLNYSFPQFLPLERNLQLFREFAGNELRRLRNAEQNEGMG